MTRRTARIALLRAMPVAVCLALAGCGAAGSAARPKDPSVSVTVASRPLGRPLGPGFVGLSFEYTAVPAYANPAVIGLIRMLVPGRRPVIRVGGNSTDETWWPSPGEHRPRGVKFALSSSWIGAAQTLASALDARLILGLNLASGRPAVARAEAAALERGIGPDYIQSFEIGNEPDLYGLFPWPGTHLYRRPAGYSLGDFIRQFSRWRGEIGRALPVTGPAYATFDWSLGRFIAAEPGLQTVTFHHYPLDACLTNPSASGYPTIARLLSDESSRGLAAQLAPAVAVAHAHHLAFRLDELNSASCSGKPGVSNAPASAVWMLDTLFNLARVGVDGVNVHTYPGAAYAPFGADGTPYPEYYGMLMFARAFPPGARLLPVAVSPDGPVKAWATSEPTVVVINKSSTRTYDVRVHAPGLSGSVRLERLRGASRTGSTGSIIVPPASAVLITK